MNKQIFLTLRFRLVFAKCSYYTTHFFRKLPCCMGKEWPVKSLIITQKS